MPIANGDASAAPVIIWTLQRSGGTNFANRLARLTSSKKFHHEPFNKQRTFGHVTRAWLEAAASPSRDHQLRDAMDETLATGVNVKHCVEMMPIEISRALAEASVRKGYRHLVLYRRSIVDRLMSLYFARQTGIWGPGSASEADKETLERPLPDVPVADLVKHEEMCVRHLRAIEEHLRALRLPYFALSFEQIYDAEHPAAATAVLAGALASIGVKLSEEEFAKWSQSVRESGEQGTKARYLAAPGYETLAARVRDVTPYAPMGD
ncbi:MAG: hypothetical protein DI565_19570 [Ancylobacter novellus]|uniref:Sulphotransferase Stf0 domain-containing protein n=1 Tax=Ancylobacter novellus TaxID=921 RepID=A0A2W5K4E9_ANCNO|nr:MAG: hypothetical protein DI565_19570 [Ancylobacter novellus]